MATRDQYLQAMKLAHEAGDVEAVRTLASEVDRLSGAGDLQSLDGRQAIPDNTAQRERLGLDSLTPDRSTQVQAEGPGFGERTLDNVRLGVSDVIGGLVGDHYGAGGDPTARRWMNPQSRVMQSAVGGLEAAGAIGADALMTAGKALLPEAAQEAIREGVVDVMDSAPVKAIREAGGRFEDSYPDAARDIGQTLTVATSLLPVRPTALQASVRGQPTPQLRDVAADLKRRQETVGPQLPPPATKESPTLRQAAQNAELKTRQDKVERMLTPDMDERTTRRVRESGPMGTRRYQFDSPDTPQFERDMVKEVRGLRTVDPEKSYQHNLNAIDDEVKTLRSALDTKLAKTELDAVSALKQLDNAVNDVGDLPVLRGQTGADAVNLREVAKDLMAKKAGVKELYYDMPGSPKLTAKDVMDVRRALDEKLAAVSWETPTQLNSLVEARRALRDKLNSVVVNAVPDTDVSGSLARQSRLLGAMDVISPRAARENANRLTRAVENFRRHTGLQSPTTPQALMTTGSDLKTVIGTTALIGAYAAGKPLNAAAKGSLITFKNLLDKAIRAGGPGVVPLQADRQAILEIIKSLPSEPAPVEEEERSQLGV